MKPERERSWLLVAYGVALVAGGLVFKLADSVRESDAVVRTDARVSDFFLDHRSPLLSTIARAVTQLGSVWIVAPIVVVSVTALLLRRRWRGALIVAISSSGAAVLVEIAKQAVGRPRPPVAGRLVAVSGLAFPSGHAAQAVACYGALAWSVWELGGSRRARTIAGAAAAMIAFAVGLSRVYLGVHWPSDVVSGWLLGVGWLAALLGLASRRRRPSVEVDPDT